MRHFVVIKETDLIDALLLAGAGAVAVLAYLEYVNEAFGRLAERIKQLAG